ncbi:hypothetical protein SAMN04487948_10911 [Halogranum amylolyticum]|uniref:Uncharacterized protein n=1 Tax=Halogranum amylolyticum TaxID=660520 RepID=A0A1H8TZ66_9EURY|nr:hypothetical protein [Halogranum amylolyticum]SEO96155.1 hypothetical protein SAMN04487948_10911 [Halogranum amylolyticum]
MVDIQRILDELDAVAGTVYTLMTFVTSELVTMNSPDLNINFTDSIISVVGFDVTLALLLSVVSFGYIGVTNEFDPRDVNVVGQSMFVLGLSLTVLMHWVPQLHSAITGGIIGKVVYIIPMAALAGYAAYK